MFNQPLSFISNIFCRFQQLLRRFPQKLGNLVAVWSKFSTNMRRNISRILTVLVETIVIKYGSFSGGLIGALIGAVGTILAGWLAWQGAQEQIFYQKQANDLTGLNFLQSENDRLFSKLQLLENVYDALYALHITKHALVIKDPQIIEKVVSDTYIIVEIMDEKVRTAESDLRRGIAGVIGIELLQRINSCKSSLVVAKSLGSFKSDSLKLFELRKVDENPRVLIDYKMIPSSDLNYVEHFRSELVKCFDRSAAAITEIKLLRSTVYQQIKNIDLKTSLLRDIYSR